MVAIATNLFIPPTKTNKQLSYNWGIFFNFRNAFRALTSDEISQQINALVNHKENIFWKHKHFDNKPGP